MSGILRSVGSLFTSSPGAPPTPPVAPSPTDAQTQAQMNSAAQQQAAQMQRGTAAVLATGGRGVDPNQLQTSKVLLGQ